MADASIAPSKHSRKWQDRTGDRFGFLVAVEPCRQVLSSGRKMSAWRLRCDCGNEVVAMTVNLAKGKHMSCGCQRLGRIRYSRGDLGVAKMPEYRVFRQMLDRCYLITAPNYRWYGAKGVTVSNRWTHGENGLTGFLCFMADMGPRPKGLTLDRIDPFLPYGPDNCRWATWKEQGVNRREHHMSEPDRAALRQRRRESRSTITPAIRSEILARLAAGEKQWPIARSLGMSQTTVSYVKLGVR